MNLLLRIVTDKPGKVLLFFSILLVLAILITGRLKFKQDIFALLPEKDRTFQVLVHSLQASKGGDNLYLLLQSSQGRDELLSTAESMIDRLKNMQIQGDAAFERVTCKKSEAVSKKDLQDLLQQFMHNPHYFLSNADKPEVKRLLQSEQSMEDELQRYLALLSTPNQSGTASLVTFDPFNFRQFLLKKLRNMQTSLNFAPGPYLLSVDQKSLIILADPLPRGKVAAKEIMQEISSWKKAYPHTRIGMSGQMAIAAQEETLLRGDLLACILGSAIAISVLFLLAYRRFMVLLFILIPIGIGLQLALGVMSLLFGKVHLMAVAFAAVILGLGIDFAIHIYDRYSQERLLGNSSEDSARCAVFKTGRAVLLGGMTSLCAFFALIATDSEVLAQIGWLVGLGLFFCLLCMLLALPAWLIWIERYSLGKKIPRFRLLGMDKAGAFISKHPLKLLLISSAAAIVLAPGIFKLQFEQDISALHPENLKAIKVQRQIQNSFAPGERPLLVAWQAKTPDQFWQKGRQLDAWLQSLAAQKKIAGWTSITRISAGAGVHVSGIQPEKAKQLLSSYGLDSSDFPQTFSFIQRLAAKENGVVGCAGLKNYPEMFERFYMCSAEDGLHGLTWIRLKDRQDVAEVTKSLKRRDKDLLVVDLNSVLELLMHKVGQELALTLSLAAFLVLAMIWINFKSIRRAFMALLPVLLGMISTLGLMGYAQVKINPVNFIILPILVGIGIDDGIHILSRFRETGRVDAVLQSSGRSIFLTTLTTCLGFGSLVLARYQVLSAMGLLAIIGVCFCFFYSVLTLAPILRLKSFQNTTGMRGD